MSLRVQLVACLPQVFALVIAATGAFGNAVSKRTAAKTADFMAQGGGDRRAIQMATVAHAQGVLAITSFMGTFFAVAVDTSLTLATNADERGLLSGVLILSLLALGAFVQVGLTHAPHELALNRLSLPFPVLGKRYLNIPLAQAIELGTLLLLVLSAIVAVVKLDAPAAVPVPAAEASAVPPADARQSRRGAPHRFRGSQNNLLLPAVWMGVPE